MHAKRTGVAVAGLYALLVSSWVLPDAAASEEAREPAKPLAEMTVAPMGVDWSPRAGSEGLVLTVAGPGDFYLREEFPEGQSPRLNIFQSDGKQLSDGIYTYELRRLGKLPERPLLDSGYLPVRGGSFVVLGRGEPRITTSRTRVKPITANQVVTGYSCIGDACGPGADDFPVLKLKSDLPWILLDDVGSQLTPAHAWAIKVNDFLGPGEFFQIQDISASTAPFTIEGGAPHSALYIRNNGNLGLGTSTPAKKLHVLGSDGTTQGLIEETNGTTAFRTMLELKNNGASRLNFNDSSAGATWGINNNSGNLNMIRSGTGGLLAFSLQPNGTLTVVDLIESSDRDMKTDIVAVHPEDILAKVSRLPLATWRFKNDEAKATHLGPMAQDFSATFGLGHDDKHIKPLDVAGVSLAAVQALHRKVTEKEVEIAQLRRENADLAQRLAALEALVLRSAKDQGSAPELSPAP